MTDAPQRTQVDRAIALYGTMEPVPERVQLEAGPVSLTLENGALRWIRLGDVEVLRGVAFLVRDRNWGTPSPEMSALDLSGRPAAFACASGRSAARRTATCPGLRRSQEAQTARCTSPAAPRRRAISSPIARASSSCTRSRGSPAAPSM